VGLYKRGGVYWYKFMFHGELIRESTKQTNDKVARKMEAAHRARMAEQKQAEDAARERLGCAEVLTCHECEELFNAEKAIRKDDNVFCTPKCAADWGKARSMPTLKQFLHDRFIPDAEVRHKAKPATVRYYTQSAEMLKRSKLAELRMDEITEEHAQLYAAEHSKLTPSGINRGLRTLRRALNLAYKWGVIAKPVKVELAKGETQRDRVLNDGELAAYFAACDQPWKDAATIIAEEGMRPGEVFALQWPHILLSEDGSQTGMIQVVDGKSKAARRVLPMTPVVYRLLKARYDEGKEPTEGFIFPSASKSGKLTSDGIIRQQHEQALADSKVAAFPPYTLRHTALTRLGEAAGGDVFALARIAGHSSITITQRYVHPQAETIDRVFSKAQRLQKENQKAQQRKKVPQRVGTKLGTVENRPKMRLTAGGR
jgi:integrase